MNLLYVCWYDVVALRQRCLDKTWLFSQVSLSQQKIPGDDVDPPPGVFPLSEPDSSQPGPDLPTDQKQIVRISLQSQLCLDVPPDSNQNSTLSCD